MNGCSRPAYSKRLQRSSPRRQRGASLVFVAVSIFALIAAAAAALDVGNLYLTQRNLQRMANMAAIDAARDVSGCTGLDTPSILAGARASAEQSVVSNGGDVSLLNQGSFAIGEVFTDGGLRNFRSVANITNDTNAAFVRLQRPAPLSFASAFSGNTSRNLNADAVAQNINYAGIGIGTGLVNLDTDDSALFQALFPGLLSASLGAVTYEGLANTRVSIAGLMAAAGTNDIQTFLSLNGEELVTALNVVTNELNTGAIGINPNGPSAANISIGDILNISADVSQAALTDALFNAGDLLIALGLATRAESGVPLSVGIPPTVLNLLGGTATVELHVIEPPQFAVGRPGLDNFGDYFAEARSSQVDLVVTLANLGSLPGLQSLVNQGVLGLSGLGMTLHLSVAQGSAGLDFVNCARSNQQFHNVEGTAQTAIASIGNVGISLPSVLNLNSGVNTLLNGLLNTLGLGGLLGCNVSAQFPGGSSDPSIGLTLSDPVTLGSGPQALQFPPVNSLEDLPLVEHVSSPLGSSLLNAMNDLSPQLVDPPNVVKTNNSLTCNLLFSLTSQASIRTGALGIVTSQVVPAVVSALTGLISPLVTDVLDPLLAALGLQFGTADVFLTSLSIGQPQLVSTQP